MFLQDIIVSFVHEDCEKASRQVIIVLGVTSLCYISYCYKFGLFESVLFPTLTKWDNITCGCYI